MNTEISVLKELLSKGLYLDNLDDIFPVCKRIADTLADPLPIYVLSSILRDIYVAWDDRPLPVEEANRVESALLPLFIEVVNLMESSADSNRLWSALNNLVRSYSQLGI